MQCTCTCEMLFMITLITIMSIMTTNMYNQCNSKAHLKADNYGVLEQLYILYVYQTYRSSKSQQPLPHVQYLKSDVPGYKWQTHTKHTLTNTQNKQNHTTEQEKKANKGEIST